jgi:hypothetical protein
LKAIRKVPMVCTICRFLLFSTVCLEVQSVLHDCYAHTHRFDQSGAFFLSPRLLFPLSLSRPLFLQHTTKAQARVRRRPDAGSRELPAKARFKGAAGQDVGQDVGLRKLLARARFEDAAGQNAGHDASSREPPTRAPPGRTRARGRRHRHHGGGGGAAARDQHGSPSMAFSSTPTRSPLPTGVPLQSLHGVQVTVIRRRATSTMDKGERTGGRVVTCGLLCPDLESQSCPRILRCMVSERRRRRRGRAEAA